MSTQEAVTYEEFVKAEWDSIEVPVINISALRRFLNERIPFYSQALNQVNITLIDKPDLPSFGYTNGHEVFFSPKLYAIYGKFVTTVIGNTWFSTPELGCAFILLHEIGHIIFDSFGRQGHRNARLWNVATDYQINQFVVRLMKESNIFKSDESYTQFMKVVNKNLVLDPAKYLKLSAEDTYADIYKRGKSGGDFGSFALNGDMAAGDEESLTSEEKMQRDIIKEEMKNYLGKNGSKLPGNGTSYGRDVEFIKEPPKVSLRDVLKQITDRENGEDWAWTSRGSRMDYLMPNNIRLPIITDTSKDKIKKCVVVIDSSGSMSSEQLNDALNIIRELQHVYTKNDIHLIMHTDTVVFNDAIENYSQVPTNVTGGTAFRCVIDAINDLPKQHVIPSCVIWITDLYGELDTSEYNARVFPFHKKLRWVISGGNPNFVPNVGKTYFIDVI